MPPLSVLIICTGNACRSQMAEALLRRAGGPRVEACSAGSHPAGYVHPLAINAMREIGVDISQARSKGLDEFMGRTFDCVITVCDHAATACPAFPAARRTLHWPMEDPVALRDDPAAAAALARRVRDDLDARLIELLKQEADD